MKIQDLTHDTVPASVSLVKAVRNELKADISALDHKVDALKGEFNGLKCEFSSLKSEVTAGREEMRAHFHRAQVLAEEQRSENRIVLDGIKNLIQRQDRLETDVGELRSEVRALSRSA